MVRFSLSRRRLLNGVLGCFDRQQVPRGPKSQGGTVHVDGCNWILRGFVSKGPKPMTLGAIVAVVFCVVVAMFLTLDQHND